MPTVEKVFNATLEPQEFQVYSRPFKFMPREFTEVDELYLEPIVKEHGNRGLFVFNNGDDLKAKERSALMKYLQRLNMRIGGYQMEMDQDKKNGATVEMKTEHKRALRWREEIMQKLEMEAPIEKEHSFLDAKPLVSISPDDMAKVEVKTPAPEPKPTSFKHVDISKESKRQ